MLWHLKRGWKEKWQHSTQKEENIRQITIALMNTRKTCYNGMNSTEVETNQKILTDGMRVLSPSCCGFCSRMHSSQAW